MENFIFCAVLTLKLNILHDFSRLIQLHWHSAHPFMLSCWIFYVLKPKKTSGTKNDTSGFAMLAYFLSQMWHIADV